MSQRAKKRKIEKYICDFKQNEIDLLQSIYKKTFKNVLKFDFFIIKIEFISLFFYDRKYDFIEYNLNVIYNFKYDLFLNI